VTDLDPFDALRRDPADDFVAPRPEFARGLRRSLADLLGNPAEVPLAEPGDTHSVGTDLPVIDLPDRSTTMAINTETSSPGGQSADPGGGDRVARLARNGRIWPAIAATDAPALIRLAVDVLGFTEQIVVPGDGPGVVAHSQLAWPEGGVVQISTAHREDNVFSDQAVGAASIYVVTDDPMSVYRRAVTAGLEIVREPESPDYDPGGSGFGLRDPEGNLWSFGTYAGE